MHTSFEVCPSVFIPTGLLLSRLMDHCHKSSVRPNLNTSDLREQNTNNQSKTGHTKLASVRQEHCIPTKLKDKVYKTAIKPAMVYGAECWAVRKKEERNLHTTEMRMLRWERGKTRLDHVRNVDIWKEARMYPMAEFLREKRLRWFGHVQRRDKDDATRKILQMTVDGKRNRGRPKLRW